uniref:Uncharacterized protein n=1 Tax=Rhizophora mucronata TaxID=61149 RepID=A0A2P2N8P3_RHIMU
MFCGGLLQARSLLKEISRSRGCILITHNEKMDERQDCKF